MCWKHSVLFYCPRVMLQQKDRAGQKRLQPEHFPQFSLQISTNLVSSNQV